jgi:hypothetical protein
LLVIKEEKIGVEATRIEAKFSLLWCSFITVRRRNKCLGIVAIRSLCFGGTCRHRELFDLYNTSIRIVLAVCDGSQERCDMRCEE